MLNALLTQLMQETTQRSLRLAAPELVLTGGIVLMLLARVFGIDRRIPAHWLALWSALGAFGLSLTVFANFNYEGSPAVSYFTGLMVFDQFAAFVRLLLLLFLVFVLVLSVLTGIPDHDDGPDYYTLLLGCSVGLLLMTTAQHLLMAFLAIEMVSAPSYALVGFLKGRQRSSEAALKYVIYGAGAAGVTLYGMTLVAGLLGTAEFPEMAVRLRLLFSEGDATLSHAPVRVLTLGLVMIFAGLAFKLSVVPFHFWTPDAYQGATAEVAGFLSVGSKIAAVALLVRFALAMTYPLTPAMDDVLQTVGVGLGLLGAVTATYGNLAAYPQLDIKRLWAYSTIAHAGYLLMALAALVVVQTGSEVLSTTGTLEERSTRAVAGVLYYLAAYLFMNWTAFAIAALLRNEQYREDLSSYDGLGTAAPLVAGCLAVTLFSLIGLPPLGGFVAKLFVFAAVYDAGLVHPLMWAVLAVGVLNTLIGLVYYLRLLKRMYFHHRPEGLRPVAIPVWSAAGCYLILMTLPSLALGLWVEPVSAAARLAAGSLFREILR